MKLKAIFPEVVLGHLYMKKYGLTREQRTTVVRATGGSSRFRDVGRIMRASDFEDRRPESQRGQGSRDFRREAVLEAGEESQSMSEPSLVPSDEEVYETDLETEDDETAAELQEIFEAQKKAKANVKKFYRDYRTSRKKVKEIKKSRQGYMPVVAVLPDDPGPSRAQAAVPTFKYDRKGGKEDGRRKPNRPKKEEVNILSSQALTEFAYMLSEAPDDLEIYLASVPCGSAVIDTGCTSSLAGKITASKLEKLLAERGAQGPESLELPPVQLKGFNGAKTTSKEGLRWTVKLGNLGDHRDICGPWQDSLSPVPEGSGGHEGYAGLRLCHDVQ